jgi:thiol-disulfide isomerase/thioredoxin
MQKRKLFLLLVFFIPVLIGAHPCHTNHSQERDINVIRLNFGTNEYEELMLRIRCEGDSIFYFSGSLKNDSWIFEYPCSLYEKCFSFSFYIPVYTDTIDKHSISFEQIINNDTIRAAQYLFNDVDTVIINAGLKIKTNTFQDVKLLDDVYFLNDTTDKEFLSSVESAANRAFITSILDPNYYEIIDLFAKTVRKYPDSHSLIRLLYGLKKQYYRRDNVQKIYDNFSDKQKQSYFGTEIRKFLSDTDTVFYFKNTLLPAWNTGNMEPIIKYSSKINLVIFSASWCPPCIAEIPLLKKIAGELGDKIEMVYVSMDKTTTVDAWKKLMIDKEIVWRSVLAAYNLEEIKQQFFNPNLPTVLMVYPDGKYETIEVRYDADLKKLYEIVGKMLSDYEIKNAETTIQDKGNDLFNIFFPLSNRVYILPTNT